MHVRHRVSDEGDPITDGNTLPRTHMRRSHVRRLANGQEVTIRECIVKTSAGGGIGPVQSGCAERKGLTNQPFGQAYAVRPNRVASLHPVRSALEIRPTAGAAVVLLGSRLKDLGSRPPHCPLKPVHPSIPQRAVPCPTTPLPEAALRR